MKLSTYEKGILYLGLCKVIADTEDRLEHGYFPSQIVRNSWEQRRDVARDLIKKLELKSITEVGD